MKAFKKVIAITLALMLALLAVVVPVSAAKSIPLIVVNGFASKALQKTDGSGNTVDVFPPTDSAIQGLVANIVPALVKGFTEYGINKDDWNKLADELLPIIYDFIDPISYNPDGTPKYEDVKNQVLSAPMSSYAEDKREELFSVFGVEYGKQYGADYVYSFDYDWRKSPIDCAAELDAFIAHVKAETGASKVNIVAISQGAAVTLAYMANYDTSALNNVVYASPAWQGTSVVGNLLTGNIKFDIFAMENFLVMLANGSAVTHFAAVLASSIATYEGLSREYFAKIDYVLQQMLPRIYSDIIKEQIAGMPGVWCLCPDEYYEAGKAYIYPEGMNADFEAKLDAYNAIQTNAQQIIENAENNGVKFGVVCGYNCQIAPINEEYPTSDRVIDTKYSSGGATCADYLKAFDDWGVGYTQKIKDDHNHVSWDMKIDASTCMFPEQTWFIKNLTHVGYNANNKTSDIVMWLLSMNKQYTVQTDENYPQFNLYNTYKDITTPAPSEGIRGDLDGSGAVTTVDARIALKIASEILKADEEQLFLGDIDEDGEITVDDARMILRLAIGLGIEE